MKKTLLLLSIIFISISNKAQTELWGMTSQGGQDDVGVIFKTDGSGNNPIVEYNFLRADGSYPFYTHLTQASDGKLYGMTSTSSGGSGALFQYDPSNNTYIDKFIFSSISGSGGNPYGSLVQASDGMLYGMTSSDGANGYGVLFQYDPIANIYTKKMDFSGVSNGSTPYGSLIQASDGKLYGMTSAGGTNNLGVLFQYDPATNIYTKKLDFDGTTKGSKPLDH